MDISTLETQLIRDEGLKLMPYVDTVGKVTIGVGRNLSDTGISQSEAMVLCNNNITTVVDGLDKELPWWRGLSEGRQCALGNMCFNMGIAGLSGFHTFLSLMQSGDYEGAANDLMGTLWARQVGARATRIEQAIRSGDPV